MGHKEWHQPLWVKNSICIDANHGFIRRYDITPPNNHDSQMLTQVLDPKNRDDFAWADSG